MNTQNRERDYMGKWIKREKGCWKAITPDGGATQWITSLLPPESLIDVDAPDISVVYAPTYECSECGSGGWGVLTNTFPESMNFCPYCEDKKEGSEKP